MPPTLKVSSKKSLHIQYYGRHEPRTVIRKYSNQIEPLRPLHYILATLAVGPINGKNIWIKRIYCCLVISVLFVAVIFSIKGRMDLVLQLESKVEAIFDYCSLATSLTISTWNIISSLFNTHSIHLLKHDNFKIMDCLLDIDKPMLGSILKMFVTKNILLFIASIAFVSAFDFYTLVSCFNIKFSLIYSVNYFLTTINSFVILHFLVLMYNLWNKFFILNVQLRSFYQYNKSNYGIDSKYVFASQLKPSALGEYYYKFTLLKQLGEEDIRLKKCNVDKLMKVYMIGCDQAELINKLFSVHILLATLEGIISIISSLRYIVFFGVQHQIIQDGHIIITPIVTMINMALYDIFILYLIISSCENITSEARKTSILLDTITYNEEHQQKLESWSQLTSKRYPAFTACDIFDINYNLFLSMTATVITYFIILLQMDR